MKNQTSAFRFGANTIIWSTLLLIIHMGVIYYLFDGGKTVVSKINLGGGPRLVFDPDFQWVRLCDAFIIPISWFTMISTYAWINKKIKDDEQNNMAKTGLFAGMILGTFFFAGMIIMGVSVSSLEKYMIWMLLGIMTISFVTTRFGWGKRDRWIMLTSGARLIIGSCLGAFIASGIILGILPGALITFWLAMAILFTKIIAMVTAPKQEQSERGIISATPETLMPE